MKPLNYAILLRFLEVPEADTYSIMDSLREDYGTYRAFRPKAVAETLMSANANGILEETQSEFGEDGELRTYYCATDFGKQMIRKYISL
jgi:DNA-binding PadR family transcriptional regulator